MTTLYTLLLLISFPVFTFSCGEYSHLFTEEEYALISSKRLRTEIRSMDVEDWNDIADALRIMKDVSGEDGREIYGPKFRNYDDLICKHMLSSADIRGDQAHFIPGFMIFHRIIVLEAEQSILAIKPNLDLKNIGLPYWDLGVDLDDYEDWRDSDIFNDTYLGSLVGNPDENFIVTDGKFSYWPIKYVRDIPDHKCLHIKNSYGYLRSPISTLKTKYLTRYGAVYCDDDSLPVQQEYYDICPTSRSIIEWHDCQKATIHGPLHDSIGGTTHLFDGQAPKESSDLLRCTDFPCDTCTNWYFGLFNKKIVSNYMVPDFGCIKCNETCDVDNPEHTMHKCHCHHGENVVNNTCYIKNETGLLIDRDETQVYGDFGDVMSSTNDPVFWFHHPRIDLNFYRMNLQNYDLNPYFGFPENGDGNGYGYGSNLDNIISSTEPFIDLFPEIQSDKPLTFRDVMDQTTILKAPYVYDRILDEINPYCDDNEANENEETQVKLKKKFKLTINPFSLL